MLHSSCHRPWSGFLLAIFIIATAGCNEKAGDADGSGGTTGSAGKSASGDVSGSGGQVGAGGSVATNVSTMTGGASAGSGNLSSGGTTAATGGKSTAGQGGTGTSAASGGSAAAGDTATPGTTSVGGTRAASTTEASGGRSSGNSAGTTSGGTASGGTGSGGRATGGTAGTTTSSTGEPTRSAGCGTTNPPKNGKYTINAAGLDRTYVIDVPTNYDPNKAYKLLFAWHPNGGNAQSIADTDGGYYGIKPIANNTTIFVAGDGISAGWANTNDRDIAFVKAMLERFYSQLCIDKSRIFSTGWSYGGMFSFALGCAMGDVFRAIAPTSGALMSGCANGNHPVAMWGAHGTNDTLVNIASGRSARDVFLTRNHCSKTTSAPDANKCVKYDGCDSGYPVVWCEWGGGHLYPPFGAAETWKFFSQF